MTGPDNVVIQQRLTPLLDSHLRHLGHGRDELHEDIDHLNDQGGNDEP